MSIIKLRDVGDSHVATISGAEVVKGEYGEQVRFTGVNGDTIYVGREPADRQLARCGFIDANDPDEKAIAYENVVGETLIFSREANTKKKGAAPFWSITVATPADTKAKPVSKRLTGPGINERIPEPASGDLPNDPASDHNRPAVVLADAPEPEEADPRTEARRRNYAAYKALWRDCAEFQRAVCEQGDEMERIPFDAASINAMAAAVAIGWDKLGLAVR